MKKRFAKTLRSVLSFALAAAMVMGLSGTTSLAAEGDADSAQGQKVIVRQEVEGTAETSFTYHIYEFTDPTDETARIEGIGDIHDSVPGAGFTYGVYNARGRKVSSGVTGSDGSFTLNAGEYAEFSLAEGTDWYIYQDIPEDYPLLDVTADGSCAYVVGSIEGRDITAVVQHMHGSAATADKSALQAEYDSDLSFNEEDYTPESWASFEEAMEHAREVLDDPDATQEEIDQALDDLEKAREGLEPKEDSEPEPEPTVDVIGTLTWDDGNNQDGLRPASVIVTLFADGKEADFVIVTADVDGSWSYQFTDLPEKDRNGTEITYTVEMEAVAGYEISTDGHDITATHIPETVSVSGEKVWDDGDNQDGIRPESVEVMLLADGSVTENVTTSAEDGWTFDFGEQPKYAAGSEITYSVVEEGVDAYSAAYDVAAGEDDYVFTITNAYTPETTSVTVFKVWSDAGDQDGVRPEDVTVTLLRNEEVATDESGEPLTLTLSDANDWMDTFADLPKYQYDETTGETESYDYSIEEIAVPSYDSETTKLTDEAYVCVNEYTPKETAVTVDKVWDDGDDHDRARPESVAVTLFAQTEEDAEPGAVEEMTLDAAGNWAGTFSSLPVYRSGKEITYTVAEEAVDDYDSAVTGNAQDGFTITNTHVASFEIPVTKVWEDSDDQDGFRPEEVTVTLSGSYTDGSGASVPCSEQEITLTAADGWTSEFTGVTVYYEGHEVAYTVSETMPGTVPEGAYEYEVTGSAQDGFTITNTHTPEEITVTAEKVWEDNDNEDKTRPDSVTVHLWNADTETHLGSLTLNESNGWSASFAAQPKYQNGQEIGYEVTEEAVDGYLTDAITIDENGTATITNTYGYGATIDITGTKVWVDNNDQDGARPEHVTLELYADGDVATDTNGDPITKDVTPYTPMSAAAASPFAASLAATPDEWAFSFTDLPKYNADHEKITYTVEELAVAGYDSEISGNMADGFTVTNTHTPGQTSVAVQKEWDDADDQDGIRPETVTVQLYADGTAVEGEGGTVTLDKDNGWAASFEGLDEYADGKTIAYTVEETKVPDGYVSATTGDAVAGYVITNSHTPETIDITGEKFWDDDADRDRVRPEYITIHLLADDKEIDSKKIAEEDDWLFAFTNLPKYENGGQEVAYTFTETMPSSAADVYTSSGFEKVDGDGYAYTVTNTHAPALYNEDGILHVTIDWPKEEAYGHLPDSVTVTLYADGEPLLDEQGDPVTITLTADDADANGSWIGAFSDLYKYEDGAQISYSVEVTATDPAESLGYYTPKITESTDGSITITMEQRYYDFDEEIVEDESDRDSWTHSESVNEYNAIEIEMSTKLPDMDGEELQNGDYTIVFHDELDSALHLDESAADFTVTIDGKEISSSYYTITLADGTNPTRFMPYAAGSYDDDCAFHVEVDLTELYKDNVITDDDLMGGTEIMVFFFADLEGTGLNGTYKSTAWYEIQNDGEVLFTSDPDVIEVYTYEIQITKYDEHDAAAVAGAAFGLYYDKDCTEAVSRNGAPYTAVSDADGIVDFYGLAAGTYYIKETAPAEGYLLSDAVLSVTLDETLSDRIYSGEYANAELYSPADPVPGYEPGTITVTKKWVDDGTIRPDEVEVILLADGTEVESETVKPTRVRWYERLAAFFTGKEVSGENDWTCTFTDLPMYNDAGDAIVYTVDEVSVPGYKSEISYGDGDESVLDGTAVVTNTQLVNTDDNPGGNNPNDNPANDGKITATKLWNDGADENGLRAGYALTLTGTAGDATVYEDTIDLSADEDTCTWSDLAGYCVDENGDIQKVTYAVSESTVPAGYKTAAEGDAADGFTVTNTLLFNTGDNDPGDPDTEGNDGKITVKKVWQDASGTTHDPVTVTLDYQYTNGNGASVSGTADEMTLTDDAPEGAFSDLPAYSEDGHALTYSIEEVEVPADYESVISGDAEDGYTVTNKLLYLPQEGPNGEEPDPDYEAGTITVTKVWDDDSDRDGVRPEEITVSLMNGEDIAVDAYNEEMTATVTGYGDEWTCTFADLPAYDADGREIAYTVAEDLGDADETYTAAVSYGDGNDSVTDGTATITNTHVPELLNENPDYDPNDPNQTAPGTLTARKVWDDSDDQDGMRDTYALTLTGTVDDGATEVYKDTQTLSASTDSYTWEGLFAKADGGREITYTLAESYVPDKYTSEITGDMETGFTVTNTHVPELLNQPDPDDPDYDPDTAPTPGTLTVTKDWYDDENHDGFRPDHVSVRLLANGAPLDGDIYVLNGDNSWTHTFEGLYKYADGEEIDYTVEELYMTDEYEPLVVGDVASGALTIWNIHADYTASVKITKDWSGDEAWADEIRPDSVTVTLYADDVPTDRTAQLAEEDGWTATIDGIPVFEEDKSNTQITYTIHEDDAPVGYTADVATAQITKDADGNYTGSVTITNTLTTIGDVGPDDTDPDATVGALTVKKEWVDGDARHDDITANVYSENWTEDDAFVIDEQVTLSDANDWSVTLSDLPAFNGDNERVRYAVSEEAPAGYDTDIAVAVGEDATSAVITNTALLNGGDDDPDNDGMLTVAKKWDDGSDAEGARPETVTVRLLADGDAALDKDGEEITATMSAAENGIDANTWSYTFTDLPGYSEDGEITYTVAEDPVAGYTTKIAGDMTDGYTVTNTVQYGAEGDGEITVTKHWVDDGTIRPDEVEIILLADGTEVESETVEPTRVRWYQRLAAFFTGKEVSGENDWTCTFTDLSKYDESGDPIVYTVDEVSVPGYKSEISYGDENESVTDGTAVITNTQLVNTDDDPNGENPNSDPANDGKITATKVWNDGADENGLRAGYALTLTGTAGDATVYEDTIDLSANEDTCTWSDLAGYCVDESGDVQKITYAVSESTVPAGYKTAAEGDAADGFTVTNTLLFNTGDNEPGDPDTEDNDGRITVKKVWQDAAGTTHDPVTVTLDYQYTNKNGATVSGTAEEIILTDDAPEGAFSDLPAYSEDGHALTYSIEEVEVPADYASVISGDAKDGYTITNKLLYRADDGTGTPDPAATPGELTVTKVWDDDSDRDGVRPDSVNVKLYTDTEAVNEATDIYGETAVGTWAKNGDAWTCTYEDMPAYDADGEEIPYYAAETMTAAMDGVYAAKHDGALTIINTHASELVNAGDGDPDNDGKITATKVWVDDNDRDGLRGAYSLTLTGTIGEGAEQATVWSDTQMLSASTDTYTWAGLYAKADGGADITYALSETFVPDGYASGVAGDAQTGFTVTNTHDIETLGENGELPVTKIWVDDSDNDHLRAESVTFTLTDGENVVTDDAGNAISVTLSADDADKDADATGAVWTGALSVGDLPRYADGTEIAYTLTEAGVSEEYSMSCTPETDAQTGAITGFTVTNVHEDYTADITITKVWEDGEWADVYRPDSVDLIIAGGGQYQTVTLRAEDDWTLTLADMPLNRNGEEVRYVVREEDVPGYTSTDSGVSLTPSLDGGFDGAVTITNTLKTTDNDPDNEPGLDEPDPEAGEITGPLVIQKTWVDGNDVHRDSYQVTLTVYSEDWEDDSGEPMIQKDVTLTAADGWAATVTGLPAYRYNEDGTVAGRIRYAVSEAAVSGYAYTTSGFTTADGETMVGVTNTELLYGGDNDPDNDGALTVTKVWDDGSDRDERRPGTIDVHLFANGDAAMDAYGDAAAISWEDNGDNTWTGTYADMPAYDADGEITYTLTEDKVTGYRTAIEGGAADGFTVTNTLLYDGGVSDPGSEESGTITVTKEWIDDGTIRPGSVTVTLLANGTEVESDTAEPARIRWYQRLAAFFTGKELSEENAWTCTFTDLSKYDENGEAIVYTVEEEAVQGYKSEISYGEGNTCVTDGTAVITNTQLVNTDDDDPDNDGKIEVTKVWLDGHDADELRPSSIEAVLMTKDGPVTDDEGEAVTITLGEKNGWDASFAEVALYDANGDPIEYTVEEVDDGTGAMDAYTTSYSYAGEAYVTDGTATITNTQLYVDGTDPEYGALTITKVWQDGARTDRPAITVRLQNGDEVVETVDNDDWTDTVGDKWTYTFHDLPKYDSDNHAIDYTLTEDALDGYETAIDGFTVTNTLLVNGGDDDPTNDGALTVTKEWNDGEDRDRIRPASVEASLLANGTILATVTVTEGDGWTHTFTDLPAFDADGAIAYTVQEAQVNGYSVSYDYGAGAENASGGAATIVNTHEPETIGANGVVTVTKVWEDAGNSDGLRPDDITLTLTGYVDEDTKENVIGDVSVTLAAAADNPKADTWSGTIDGLYKYYEGEEITYVLTEPEVENYASFVDENTTNGVLTGYTVTNRQLYLPESGTTDTPGTVTVTKVWEDDYGEDGFDYRPADITISLKNGDAVATDVNGDPVTATLTEQGNALDDATWSYTFTDLPAYNADQTRIHYTALEEGTNASYYDTAITYSGGEYITDGTATITNTFIPEQFTITGTLLSADEGEPLRGATFELYQVADNGDLTYVGIYVTDADGHFATDVVAVGNYRIVQTYAPEGYLAIESFDVEVSYSQKTYAYTLYDYPVASVVVSSDIPDSTDNTKVYDGGKVTLTAAATGLVEDDYTTVSYQWYKDGQAIDGATKSTLELDGDVADSGEYMCVVTEVSTHFPEKTITVSDTITVTIKKADQSIVFTDGDAVIKAVTDVYTNVITEDSVIIGDVTYKVSGDEGVVTIDENGQVTVVGVGTVTITATAAETANYNAASSSYTLTAVDKGLSVTVTSSLKDKDDTKVYDGETVTLTAEPHSDVENASFAYQWYDPDGNAISGATDSTLELDGNVADSGKYTCEVTVTYPNGKTDTAKDSVTITITKADQSIVFAEDSLNKEVKDTFTNPTTDASVIDGSLSYKSSDELVATVDPMTGEVTIVGVGTATITVTAAETPNYNPTSNSYTITTTDAGLYVTVSSDLTNDTKDYNGGKVTLTAEPHSDVDGAEFTYQWYGPDGNAISGATNSTLELDGDVADSGKYTCKVTVTYPNGKTDTTEGSVTVTINRAQQDISYAESVQNITKYDYDDDFINPLTETLVFGEITYTITLDPTLGGDLVVSIDVSTGKVHILGGSGVAIITATVSGSENYYADSASYTLTVNPDEIAWEITSDHGTAVWDETNQEYVDDITYTGEDVKLSMVLTLDADETAHERSETYQWYVYENGSFTEITDATDATYTMTGTEVNAGDHIYLCVATVTYNNDYSHTIYGAIEVEIEKAAQNISYGSATIYKVVGDADFINALTQTTVDPVDGNITYTSSNTSVATVASDGTVTIVSDGTVTITATANETTNYKGDTASYTLIIEKQLTVSVTVASDTTKTYDGSGVTLTATASYAPSDATVTYQWYGPDGSAISGATGASYTTGANVADSGSYKCVVTATYGTYTTQTKTAEGSVTVTINKASQSVTFANSTVTASVGDTYTNTVTSTYYGDITYTISGDSGVATVNASTGQVTITGVGTVTITATAAGDANHNSGTGFYTITTSDAGLSVTVASDTTKTYDGSGVTLTATANSSVSGTTYTYQWYDSGGNAISGATGSTYTTSANVADSGSYTCKVTATYPNGNTATATSNAVTVTINKASQSVTFADSSVTKSVGDTYTNTVTSTYYGDITYTISGDSGVATVNSSTGQVTITGVGTVTITATAAGDANHNSASASYTITTSDSGLSVTVASDTTKTYDGSGVTLTATANSSVSGTTYTYQWYKDGTAISGATGSTYTTGANVADSGSYTCKVTATYPNGNTATATSNAVTVKINKADQNISYKTTSVEKTVGDDAFTNTLTQTIVDTAAGAKITYSTSNSNVATVDSNGKVTIVGAGTVTITATVSGTDNYNSASASYTITVVNKSAFAVYCADDNSLTFYVGSPPNEGDTYNKKVATNVYKDVDSLSASSYSDIPWNGKQASITSVVIDSSFKEAQPISLAYWFYKCAYASFSGFENLDTSKATSMQYMFYECYELTSLDVSAWDTSNVMSMKEMFDDCSKLTTLDVSKWNTSNVTDMSYLFHECYSLESVSVSGWNTSSVTNMSCIFIGCQLLTTLDVSKWNTSNVTNMSYIFDSCSSLTTVDVSKWDTSKATDMKDMFSGCCSLTSVSVSGWNTSSVTDMEGMFNGCTALTSLDLSGWNTTKVTDNQHFATKCLALEWVKIGENTNIFRMGTDPVVDFQYWYDSPTKGTTVSSNYLLDVTAAGTYYTYTTNTAFAVQSATDASLTFYYDAVPKEGDTYNGKVATNVYKDVDNLNISTYNGSPWYSMRYNITSVVIDTSFNEVQPKNFDYWFRDLSYATTFSGLSNLDTSKATSMEYMFYGCRVVTELDVSGFNTENVTSMHYMFGACNALTTLDASSWNTAKVTDMGDMFTSCECMTSVNVSSWNTSSVTDMYYMFHNCYVLTSLDLSGWDTRNVSTSTSNYRYFAAGCNALEWVKIGANTDIFRRGYSVVDYQRWYDSPTKGTIVSSNYLLDVTAAGTYYTYTTNTAFAVYSATDTSLTFYYDAVPKAGATYNGKVATNVYKDVDSLNATSTSGIPWYSLYGSITSVVIDSSFSDASPISLAYWFDNFRSATFTGLGYINTSNVTSLQCTFYHCEKLTSVDDLTGWDTSKVTTLYQTFFNCSSLTNVDGLASWDTSAATTLFNLFYQCYALTNLNGLEKWNTSNVSTFTQLVEDCTSLTNVDGLAGWDMSAATTLTGMFYECTALTSVKVSNWNTSNVKYISSMFYNCSNLISLDISGWDTRNVPQDSSYYSNFAKKCDALESVTIGENTDIFRKGSAVVDVQNWYDAKGKLVSSNYLQDVTAAGTYWIY